MRLGTQEIILIGVLLMLIFGPKQLPKLGRSIGETIKEMRGVGKQIRDSVEGKDDA